MGCTGPRVWRRDRRAGSAEEGAGGVSLGSLFEVLDGIAGGLAGFKTGKK